MLSARAEAFVRAIVAAAEDAGVVGDAIDDFCSYGADTNEAAPAHLALQAGSRGYYGMRYTTGGFISRAQRLAICSQRQIDHDGIARLALRAISLASYDHAKTTPTPKLNARCGAGR
jgi:hypothetical protein